MEQTQALVPVERLRGPTAPVVDGAYRSPAPGRSWRSGVRTLVLLGGSVGIGTGVALGWFGIGPAALFAVGLATAQVLGQTMHQNRLGQDVMGGIAGGDLERALHAAEKALEESPSGAMRTLAAANLASVLMQSDRIADGASVLDRWPPGFLHMPLSTVLWLNNRSFAALALEADPEYPGGLLEEGEKRLVRAGPRGFGGSHNYRKIASAVAGTRAMQRLAAGDAKDALQHLARAKELDDAVGVPFRVAERELCRAEALRQLGRHDEAVLSVAALRDAALTERQQGRLEDIDSRLLATG